MTTTEADLGLVPSPTPPYLPDGRPVARAAAAILLVAVVLGAAWACGLRRPLVTHQTRVASVDDGSATLEVRLRNRALLAVHVDGLAGAEPGGATRIEPLGEVLVTVVRPLECGAAPATVAPVVAQLRTPTGAERDVRVDVHDALVSWCDRAR